MQISSTFEEIWDVGLNGDLTVDGSGTILLRTFPVHHPDGWIKKVFKPFVSMPQVKPDFETFAKIKVVGIGGGGGSAINRMISEGIRGVEFIAVNTDVQALHQNAAKNKISIGKTVTRGLGAGMDPELGKRAVEENQNDVRNILNGSDMVFLTAGLGGGTGSGAITEVAKLAKDVGALCVAVVTKPFTFEGAQRKRISDEAYDKLIEHVDTVITIPNDRVLQIIDKKTSLLDAFKVVDDVLRQGVQGISDLITVPGLINVDFADVRAIMQNAGSALMGIGRATGENRAVEAAKQAIASPLLELSIDGAKGILFTITGSEGLGMHEVAEAAKVITGSADEDARVIFGANIDPEAGDEVRITVVATGFDARERRSVVAHGASEVPAQSMWTPAALLHRDHEPRRVTPAPPRPVVRAPEEPTPPPPQKKVVPDVKRVKEEEELEIPAFIRKKMM